MPGAVRKILSDRVRDELCPNSSANEWLEVARTAHKLGLKTNASMLYGHIETIEERVEHLLSLRQLQDMKPVVFKPLFVFRFIRLIRN